MKGNSIIILMVILVLIGTGVFYIFKSKNADGNKLTQSFSILSPEETPFPFQEMTIPYLRKREYKSNLRELKKYNETSTYTSYLTNYDSDGLKINGLLTIPKNTEGQKNPAIVFVHGYIAPTIYETTERYSDYVDYLARNGFVVFKIDLRGHGDSEGEAGGSYYSGDYIVDTLNAYSALQNADFVNPEKVGLWGHSMAGNVTLRSFAAKPDIPAVAIWAGAGFTYSDLLEYRISDNSYRPPQQSTERARKRQELRDSYGEFDPNHEFWKQVAASNYLNDLKGSVGLFHAIDDNVVDVEYSQNLNRLLNETTVTHEYHEYSGGGHNIEGSNFSNAMRETVEFYNKYLK